MLLSSHFKFLDEFHILFTEQYSGFLNSTRDLSTNSHRDENLRFEITKPTELLIFISLVTLATFPLSKDIFHITHMIHSNPPSVQSKQRTGRCFDVTVVLRHRREILHFNINEL